MKVTHLGFADDSEVQQIHVEEKEEDHPSPPDVEGILKQAGSTLFQLNSKIRHFCLTKIKVGWVPKASTTQILKNADNLFTIIAVAAFVSSTWLVSLSITSKKPVWAGFAQMILYVFQAYGAIGSRMKTRKRQSDEEKSRLDNTRQTSAFYCVVITAGALSATVSASIYPYHSRVSTGLSFAANLCQVIGTIAVSNTIGGVNRTD